VFTVTMEMVAAGNSSCSSPPTTTSNNQVKSLISPLPLCYNPSQLCLLQPTPDAAGPNYLLRSAPAIRVLGFLGLFLGRLR
jgi:hypothetical protein